VNFQLSASPAVSSLSYWPARSATCSNGVAPWTKWTSCTASVQGDGAWKIANSHAARRLWCNIARLNFSSGTCRWCRATRRPHRQSWSVRPDARLTDDSDLIGWTTASTCRTNGGSLPTRHGEFRPAFDAINGSTTESSSPRINVVTAAQSGIHLPRQLFRYFTRAAPQVSANSIATLAARSPRRRGDDDP
jgi:hypothetical protein